MASILRVCGIYQIRCLIHSRVYIGQSFRIGLRWNEHKFYLRLNRSKHGPLQQDWNLYGEENFVFEIIEECVKEKLIEREQYHLDANPSSYNVQRKADPRTAVARTVEQICPKTFKVIKVWNSILEIQEHLGKGIGGGLSKACREGFAKYGFYWNYVGQEFCRKVKPNLGYNRANPVVQIDSTNKVVKIWESVMQAHRYLNPDIEQSGILMRRIQSKTPYKDYKWEIYDPKIHGEIN